MPAAVESGCSEDAVAPGSKTLASKTFSAAMAAVAGPTFDSLHLYADPNALPTARTQALDEGRFAKNSRVSSATAAAAPPMSIAVKSTCAPASSFVSKLVVVAMGGDTGGRLWLGGGRGKGGEVMIVIIIEGFPRS